MSDRERWIVYPLLLFALVLGFKNTFQRTHVARFNAITCNSLRVDSLNGKKRIQMTGSDNSGFIALYGSDNSVMPLIRLGAIRHQEGSVVGNVGQIEVGNGVTRSRGILSAYANGSNLEFYSHPFSQNLKPTQPVLVTGFNPVTQKIGVSSMLAVVHEDQISTMVADESGLTFNVKSNESADADRKSGEVNDDGEVKDHQETSPQDESGQASQQPDTGSEEVLEDQQDADSKNQSVPKIDPPSEATGPEVEAAGL